MSAEPQTPVHATPKTWTSAATGITYPTSKFHWWGGRIAVCPACDCRPCDEECPEQLFPPEGKAAWALRLVERTAEIGREDPKITALAGDP